VAVLQAVRKAFAPAAECADGGPPAVFNKLPTDLPGAESWTVDGGQLYPASAGHPSGANTVAVGGFFDGALHQESHWGDWTRCGAPYSRRSSRLLVWWALRAPPFGKRLGRGRCSGHGTVIPPRCFPDYDKEYCVLGYLFEPANRRDKSV